MYEFMANLMLADGDGFGDLPWFILIVAIASALGGLFKKKNKKEPERTTELKRPPGRAPVPPRPPRIAQQRPRPVPAAPVTPIIQAVPTARLMPADTERARNRQAALQGYEAELRRRESAAIEHEVELLHEDKAPPQAGPAKVVDRRKANRLDRMLRNRSGLQTAILLSEILGQPKALRDDQ